MPLEKEGDENYTRIHGQLKAWNILTSWKIQKEAYRRAMLIKANILTDHKTENFQIYDSKNCICILDKSSGVVIKYNYNINEIRIFFTNLSKIFI